MAAIEVEGISRTFRSPMGTLRRRRFIEVRALEDVSFEAARGEIFGLLGPNGAGKTTTVRILATLLLPSKGSARVAGLDVVRRARSVRRSVGCVFGGERGVYLRLTGVGNLRFFADLYGLPVHVQRSRIPELVRLVGLAGRADHRVETYSRGMKQRLHIARALLHDPPVLLLDEPTAGLDPVAAREMRALIRRLAGRGATILLTTHYMFEADELCDRIAVIDKGRIVARGSPEALKSRVSDLTVIEVEAYGVSDAALERIRGTDGVAGLSVESHGHRQLLVVQAARDARVAGRVLAALEGVRTGQVRTRGPTLEDAYVSLVDGGDRR